MGDFFDFLGEVCAAEVAFENMSVGAKEDNHGYAVKAIGLHRLHAEVDKLLPAISVLFDGGKGVVGFIPCRGAENHEVVGTGIFLVEREKGLLGLGQAGTAPACPEIDKHIFAFADVVRQFRLFAVDRLSGQVDKHLTLLGGYRCLDCIIHVDDLLIGFEPW